ncbi:trafficking regulator of GLUT4 1, partial [Chelydra serpentina]
AKLWWEGRAGRGSRIRALQEGGSPAGQAARAGRGGGGGSPALLSLRRRQLPSWPRTRAPQPAAPPPSPRARRAWRSSLAQERAARAMASKSEAPFEKALGGPALPADSQETEQLLFSGEGKGEKGVRGSKSFSGTLASDKSLEPEQNG